MPTGTRPLPSPLSQEVGRILSAEINDRAIAQARVAEASAISAAQLSRALAGKKVFTLDQLDAVCAALGLDLVDVVSAADRAIHRPVQNITRLRNVPAIDQDDLDAVARATDPEPTDEQ